ncbi:MAG: response regulator [Phycisphaeraceae bacterium]
MPTDIKVLIADDHALLLEAVGDRLSQEPGLTVVGRVFSAGEAVDLSAQRKPDVVLLDIDLPGKASFDAARQIKADHPDTHVIYLSAFSNDRYIENALRSGCSGYLTKDEPMDTVIGAIRSAVDHGAYYSPRVRARLVVDPDKGLTLDDEGVTKASTLTPRELEILRYLAQGMSKKQIAGEVHRSVSTIDKHTENLMRKLEIHDRVELARFAIREGLIEP